MVFRAVGLPLNCLLINVAYLLTYFVYLVIELFIYLFIFTRVRLKFFICHLTHNSIFL